MCGPFIQVLMVTLQSVLVLDWQLCFSPERVKCSWMFLVPSAVVGGPLIGAQQYPVTGSQLQRSVVSAGTLLGKKSVRKDSLLLLPSVSLVFLVPSWLEQNLEWILSKPHSAQWCGHKLARLGMRRVAAVANYSCSEAGRRPWTALCHLWEPGPYLGPYSLVIGRDLFKFSFTSLPCIWTSYFVNQCCKLK